MPSETATPPTPRTATARVLAPALVLVALIGLFHAGPCDAEPATHGGTVTGTVTAMASGEPIAGAEVTLTGPGGERQSTSTDRKGKFKLKVPPGDYVLGLTSGGFAPFEARLAVQPKSSQKITVEMLDEAAGRRNQAAKHFNAGVDAYRSGDAAAAIDSLTAAAEADPTLAEPHRVLAQIHLERSDWAGAARAAEAALAAAPDDDQSLRLAYNAYRNLKDPRVVEIRRTLAAGSELAEDLAVHAFNEGAMADQGGNVTLAAARFREALELDPDLAAAHFALASHDYRSKRFDEALAGARRGLEIEPGSTQGRRLAFISLDARGDQEAAAAALDAYAEADLDGAVEILYTRGENDFLGGDFPPAIRALEKILDYRPDHAHAHRLLGLMAASTDPEAAKRHLGRFLELAPDDPEAATVRQVLAEL